jgi:hypothetical protein
MAASIQAGIGVLVEQSVALPHGLLDSPPT